MSSQISNTIDPISFAISKSDRMQRNPNVTRSVFIPLNGMLVGLIKPLVLPVISTLGVVLHAAMGIGRSCQGRSNDAKIHFHACQIFALVTIACVGFLLVTGFCLPPKVSIGLMAGIMAVSIAFHVYRTESALRKARLLRPISIGLMAGGLMAVSIAFHLRRTESAL